jgi:ergothioneine biosynthesis protein EgtB
MSSPNATVPQVHQLLGATQGVSTLAARYGAVRAQSQALAAPLSEADCQVQPMPAASPTKWHLAHATWFFETFVLERFEPGFKPHHPAYRVLFNSYYNGVGEQHPRAQRGLITRPSLAEVLAWRQGVDERLLALLQSPTINDDPQLLALVELGLQHEQQHQELMLTDLLFLLSCNPMAPVYRPRWPSPPAAPVAQRWLPQVAGVSQLAWVGHQGEGFAFDNECPRHRCLLHPHELAQRLTTHGEWLAFVQDGGYRDPRWWLSAGWDWVRSQRVQAPLYWHASRGLDDGKHHEAADWHVFTLHGLVPLDPHTPITHISYFEADAFARWWSAQHPRQPAARLPTEFEWEHAAQQPATAASEAQAAGNFLESGALHPLPAALQHAGPMQLLGDVWEWTSSAYLPYPGFKTWDGPVGEYNGKFMIDQMVLRGGSCATPRSHVRVSYRNFFPSDARWQFNGLRLARDVH